VCGRLLPLPLFSHVEEEEAAMATTDDDNKENPKTILMYKHVLHMTVGDFNQWHCPGMYQRPIDDELCDEIAVLWGKNEQMTFEEFYEEFDGQVCTDWDKIKPNGDFVTLDDWDDDGMSWESVRISNGKALYALPYPPKTILSAIEHLCRYRSESVIEVNDWLAWVNHDIKHPDQRAQENFNQYPSMISVIKMEDPSGHCNYSRVNESTLVVIEVHENKYSFH